MPDTNEIKGYGWIARPVGDEFDLRFDPGGHVPQDLTVRVDRAAIDALQSGADFDSIVVPFMRAQGIKAK